MPEVRLLGQFEVRRDGEPVPIPSRPAQSLLAYLVLNAGTAHRRERLAGLFWPDSGEADARSNLRHALWRVRKAIETGQPADPRYLIADDISVAFDARSNYRLDVAELQREVREGSADVLIEILLLYRGELLPGVYDEWAILERERLQAIFGQKMQRLLERLVADGRWRDILDWGERWIALGSAPEPAYRALMVAHSALGDRSRMAAVYQRCVESLRDELGVEPSQQTRTLYERLASGERRTGPPAAPGPIPSWPARLIGREREVAEVGRLLGETRLLTLTGPGGVGKTRLAIEAAQRLLRDFPDGVFFVGLATLSEPPLVAPAIAQALGIQDAGGEPLLVTLKYYLREKRLLLLLDNFEHLLAAAPAIAELLATCPGLRALVTSREPLHLRGEQELAVSPLALPDPEQPASPERLAGVASVDLFVQRARELRPDFALTPENAGAVGEICVQLDGLPLAIELAVARLKLFPPAALAARLESRLRLLTGGPRDAPERQRTLRATIAWSYDLLNPAEQALFRYLAVFAGGCTLAAVEEVAARGGPAGPLEVVDGVASLVDKSLVRQVETGSAEPRLAMLATLREFGQERLDAAGEVEAVRRAHLGYYLALAEEGEPQLRAAGQIAWLGRLDVERDNFRAALGWALEVGEATLACRLAGALNYYRYMRGYFREGRDWLERALAAPAGDRTSEVARMGKASVKALFGAGLLTHGLGDYPAARRHLWACVRLGRQIGESWMVWQALAVQAAASQLYPAVARSLAEEALALARLTADPWAEGLALMMLGAVATQGGDPAEGRRYLEESICLGRQVGDRLIPATSLAFLAGGHGLSGQYPRALAVGKEALAIARELGNRRAMTIALVRLCVAARCLGRRQEEAEYRAERLALLKLQAPRIGTSLGLTYARQARRMGLFDLAVASYTDDIAVVGVVGPREALPDLLEGLAELAALAGTAPGPERAARLFGAAEVLRAAGGSPPPAEAEGERALAALRAQLGELAFTAALQAGRSMTIEASIAAALEEDVESSQPEGPLPL
jgi:predicted ATPase/DNA-binding SARP family transcriptional activator